MRKREIATASLLGVRSSPNFHPVPTFIPITAEWVLLPSHLGVFNKEGRVGTVSPVFLTTRSSFAADLKLFQLPFYLLPVVDMRDTLSPCLSRNYGMGILDRTCPVSRGIRLRHTNDLFFGSGRSTAKPSARANASRMVASFAKSEHRYRRVARALPSKESIISPGMESVSRKQGAGAIDVSDPKSCFPWCARQVSRCRTRVNLFRIPSV